MRRLKDRIRRGLDGLMPAAETREVARALCAALPGISDTDYYLEPLLPSDDVRDSLLDGWIGRIAAGEPLQYVTGYTYFFGYRINCDRRALIPRPETTELVEWILQEAQPRGSLLDIGTGTGCIAISLASRLRSWRVSAWDISADALALASENSRLNDAGVEFARRDILGDCDDAGTYDIIVSNPPYVTMAERADMERNVLDFEPGLALFVPDGDPLLFYRNIADFAVRHLAARGSLFFEINPLFAGQLEQLLEARGFAVTFRDDIQGHRRMAKAYTNDE